MRPTKERAAERLERSELRRFYEDVIRRQLENDDASTSTLERHDAAVEYLERFVKRPLSPAELDDELVANFDSYLWRQGTSDGRRRVLVESLRRIGRAYHPSPSMFTKRCQRRALPDPAPDTARHYYEERYARIRLVGRTAKYIDESRAAFWALYEHFGRDPTLAECADDALLSVHIGWLLEHGRKPATINTGHLAVIKAVVNDAHNQGFVDRVPTLQKLPVDRDVMDSWSPEQIGAFIDACPAAADVAPRERLGGIRAGDWWEVLVRIAWYTGLRRRALLAIRRMPPDVDLSTGWLRTPGSSQKNHRGQPFRLGLDAIQAVSRIWEPKREFLLPYGYAQANEFYDMFHAIREAAGLPKSTNNLGCLHLLRRSAATELYLKRGIAAAQAMLGHSSPSVTLRHYIDPTKLPAHDFTDAMKPIPSRKRSATAG